MQRDVRLQAALALVVGVALVAVPIFLWGRGRNRNHAADAASALASASGSQDPGPPTVIFGDAGPAVSVDAGGRAVTFGAPRYLRCQDPGPSKTAPERCDHLGPIEELVTKGIADRAAACLPPLTSAQTVNTVIDVSFKRKKMRIKDGKDGSTMPAAARKRLMACIDKGVTPPAWDTIAHAHQRYVLEVMTTFSPTPATVRAVAP